MFIFKREKEIINKCRDYLEEKISFDDFWKLYLEDKMIMKKIRKSAIKNKHGYIDEYSIEDIKKKGQVSFFEKVALQKSIDEYLTYKRIEHYISTEELILYNKWDDVIPSFLDGVVDTYYYLEKIDPEKKHSKKWYKNFLLSTYKCEKYPPRWLQFCEWPFDEDDKPCLFLYQDGFPNRHDFINYHFRKKNGEEIVISQYI